MKRPVNGLHRTNEMDYMRYFREYYRKNFIQGHDFEHFANWMDELIQKLKEEEK